jgi:hypothetical protein
MRFHRCRLALAALSLSALGCEAATPKHDDAGATDLALGGAPDGATGDLARGGGDAGSQPPTVGGCSIFTSSDAWNRIVLGDPVDATWTAKLYANATLKKLHPDFGSGFGIPYNVVPMNQPQLPIAFDYASESDPGPYPYPGATAKIEGGTPTSCSGDCHVLALLQGACLLYEGWDCHFLSASTSWHCGSGARFDLGRDSAGQRPAGWTSADAAGLAIFPGLVKRSVVMEVPDGQALGTA